MTVCQPINEYVVTVLMLAVILGAVLWLVSYAFVEDDRPSDSGRPQPKNRKGK